MMILTWKKIKQLVRNLSLHTKMVMISLLTVTAISITTFGGLRYLNNAYNHQLYRVCAGNLSISSKTISERLKNVETLSSVMISSATIQNSLSALLDSDDARVHSNSNRAINNALATYKQTFANPGLRGISLYNDSFANSSNLGLIFNKNTDSIQKAVASGRAARGGITWTLDEDHTGYLLLDREVRKIDKLSLAHLGDLVIFVDLDQLVQDANRAVTTYENSIYLIFNGSRCIYSSGELPAEILNDLSSFPNTYSILTLNGHRFFAVRDTIPGYSYDYINLVPYDQITASIHSVERLLLLVLFLASFGAVVISAILIRFALLDMNRLVLRMDRFSKVPELPIPECSVHYQGRTDELGRLHQQFESMAAQIQQLIKVNYVNQLLNKDAKLKALESQINPHFLYNTLETINWRAKALKDTYISQMTEALGTLLRATLSNKQSLVDLSYELNLVHSYITIQNIRFEDRLIYQEQVDASLSNVNVPPLSIQPLLENAIRYGMEEMMDACTVILLIYRKEDRLLIEVRNEGSEFEEHLLEKLKNGEISPHGHGIGLLNIHQRIQILFGEQYGLSFHNDKGLAIATISIPYTTTHAEELAC